MSPLPSSHNARPILFSCAGRRNELLSRFRASAERLLQDGSLAHAPEMVVLDADPAAPALREADRFEMGRTIDRWDEPWLRGLLDRWKPAAIIPLIDHELGFWAAHRDRIAGGGATAWVSGPETVRLCLDKRATKDFLASIDIPVPEYVSGPDDAAPDNSGDAQPTRWLAKPRYGHSSRGIFPDAFMRAEPSVYGRPWLDHFLGRDDYIVEERIEGPEISVDVLADHDGSMPCAVPRYRTKTVGGEVVQSETFYDAALEEQVGRIIRALPDPFGPLNIQCIRDGQGRYRFTEINPRFGGGVTLSIAAGADMPGWMMARDLGLPFGPERLSWQADVRMSRYPQGVYSELKGERER